MMERLKLVERRNNRHVLGYRLLVNGRPVKLSTSELFKFYHVRRHTLEQVGVVLEARRRAEWQAELQHLVDARQVVEEASA